MISERGSLLPDLKMIKTLRKKAGLTQGELAKKVDMKQSSIAKIENGTYTPSYEKVERIFAVLYNPYKEGLVILSDLMSKPVLASPDWSVKKVIDMMDKKYFSQLPVVKDGVNLGTVTDKSVSRFRISGRDVDLPVTEAMEDPLPHLPGNTLLISAEALFWHFKGVLVLDRAEIVGIVTRSDTHNPFKKK